MKELKNQGSVHVVIVVCLVAALVCALGIALFQNITSISQKTAQTQDGNTTQNNLNLAGPQAVLVNASIDKSFDVALSFKYPSTWKYSQQMSGTIEKGGTWVQQIIVTSPTEAFEIHYQIGANGGLGGMCAPSESGKIATSSYIELTGFEGVSYVELAYKDVSSAAANDISTLGFAGLIDTERAKELSPGDSVCDRYLREIISLTGDFNPNIQHNNVRVLGITLKVKDVEVYSELSDVLRGEEYEQAKAIFLSTTH